MGSEQQIDPKDMPYERDYPLIDKNHLDRERLMAESQAKIQERRRLLDEMIARYEAEREQKND